MRREQDTVDVPAKQKIAFPIHDPSPVLVLYPTQCNTAYKSSPDLTEQDMIGVYADQDQKNREEIRNLAKRHIRSKLQKALEMPGY